MQWKKKNHSFLFNCMPTHLNVLLARFGSCTSGVWDGGFVGWWLCVNLCVFNSIRRCVSWCVVCKFVKSLSSKHGVDGPALSSSVIVVVLVSFDSILMINSVCCDLFLVVQVENQQYHHQIGCVLNQQVCQQCYCQFLL